MLAEAPNPWHIAADLLDPPETGEWYRPNPDDSIPGRARAKQRPPVGDWFVWLIMTGRGFGKTRTAAEFIDREARKMRRGQQILIAGRTPADVRTFSLEGAGGLLTHHPDIDYHPSHREVVWPNGVKGVIRSGANPEEFRGYSGSLAWLDEFAAWQYAEEAWKNLTFGMREGDPRIVITTTPRPLRTLQEIRDAASTVTVTGSSYENLANLADTWRAAVLDPLEGTRLGRREIQGELMMDVPGALWTQAILDSTRVLALPTREIVTRKSYGQDIREEPAVTQTAIGVDPAATSHETSDETGIYAASRCEDGHLYGLEDASLRGTPLEWARVVVNVYRRHNADFVWAESNQGGEMVRQVISQVDPMVPVKLIHATRGKDVRGQPVAALFEQGSAHLVGHQPELENELLTWQPGGKSRSPNRLDAMVYAMLALMGSGRKGVVGWA